MIHVRKPECPDVDTRWPGTITSKEYRGFL